MKKFFILQFVIFSILFNLILITTIALSKVSNNEFRLNELLMITGLGRLPSISNSTQPITKEIQGIEADYDKFPVIEYSPDNAGYEILDQFETIYGKLDDSSVKVDQDMVYKNSFFDVPLFDKDYYYRKYENAVAGAWQLNTMPTLKPGDRIELIRDRYIDVKASAGYLHPGAGYPFGSGVCWTVSTLGLMMDNANKDFNSKYGIPLFVFKGGDRAPHTHYYQTYGGRGYTVFQKSSGVPIQDYRFQVNPEIANRTDLANFKIKILIIATNTNKTASHGQSLGALVISNYNF